MSPYFLCVPESGWLHSTVTQQTMTKLRTDEAALRALTSVGSCGHRQKTPGRDTWSAALILQLTGG